MTRSRPIQQRSTSMSGRSFRPGCRNRSKVRGGVYDPDTERWTTAPDLAGI